MMGARRVKWWLAAGILALDMRVKISYGQEQCANPDEDSGAVPPEQGGKCNGPGGGPPKWPTQFRATLERTAHLLLGSTESSYPPAVTVIEIGYDFEGKRAGASVLSGMDENKTYVRNYEDKREFMVRRGEFPLCHYSYLGEEMPEAKFPDSAEFIGTELNFGTLCEHWALEEGLSRIHLYIQAETCYPFAVTEETHTLTPGVYEPLMTYRFTEFRQGSMGYDGGDRHLFEPPVGMECSRHVGGYPYLHLFHHYLRF